MPSAGFEYLALHAIPFALVVCRLAGTFLFAPLLAGVMLPQRYKILLVIMAAAAIYPFTRHALVVPSEMDVFGLLPLLVFETLLGYCVGAIASIPLLSLEMSGVIAGQQMGLGLARVYNPEVDVDTDLLGQLLYYLAMGVYIAAGGVEALLGCVMDSFTSFPVGGFSPGAAPLEALIAALNSGFELAIRVSAPVTGIVLLLVLLMGVIGKTMPQINIMTIGFAIKIIVGLAAVAFSAAAIRAAAGDEAADITRSVIRWLTPDSPHLAAD